MRLLLVEDKDTFRRLLVQALSDSSWDVLAVGDPREALEALERGPFEVLVTDLRLPGFSGIELLRRAKRMHPGLRIVLMSAFGEPRDIVEAMQCGADEFLPKPFDLDHFHSVLERLLALVSAPPPDPREPWIAHSPAMKTLDQALSKAADSRAPVLFLGEKGAGKLRAARRLHTLWNPRGSFLVISATSMPDEKDLKRFSHGSLYLTDLEQLSTAQVQGVLGAMASEESIRWLGGARAPREVPESLRLRLGVISFQLPPLRERKEDVLPLFRSFLESAARQEGRPFPLVERSVERDLLQRAWPGNIRELAWCATQALRATQGAILASLPAPMSARETTLCIPLPEPATLEIMLAELVKTAEPFLLRRTLEAHGRDPSAAAAALGLTTRAFTQRLREHRIPLEEV
jgi:DNA-binding NtrC family response regulator